jgi:hypothetical protein
MMGKVTFRQHLRCRSARRSLIIKGWVAERLKAAVLKTAVRASVPWVRIPPHPPFVSITALICFNSFTELDLREGRTLSFVARQTSW